MRHMSLTRKSFFFPKSKSRLEDTISWKCINHAKGCIHHSWHWTRFSHVLTRMSGYLIVLTWQSFSSRHDSFNLVKSVRLICNRCDLVKVVVVKVGSCKLQSSKFEVRSSKFEVRSLKSNFVVPSLPPLLSSFSSVSRLHASPNLRGRGRRRSGGGKVWDQIDFL